jgi:hypothetical protein
MVRWGSVSTVAASLGALLLLCFGASVVTATAKQCSVTVSPKSGTAGQTFTFSGSGFEPTQLTLLKNHDAAGGHALAISNDPWQVSVLSRPGDEGSWSAEFDSATCTAVATFKVTLTDTDVSPIASSAPTTGKGLPSSLVLAVVGLGLGGGIFMGRRVRGLAVDNRPQ